MNRRRIVVKKRSIPWVRKTTYIPRTYTRKYPPQKKPLQVISSQSVPWQQQWTPPLSSSLLPGMISTSNVFPRVIGPIRDPSVLGRLAADRHMQVAIKLYNEKEMNPGLLYAFMSHQDLYKWGYPNSRPYLCEIMLPTFRVVPYLDIEYYESDISPESFLTTFISSLKSFCLPLIPNLIISMSHGHDPKHQKSKFSFHVLVRGIGFFPNNLHAGKWAHEFVRYVKAGHNPILCNRSNSQGVHVVPVDLSVYKPYQALRLLHCIKPGSTRTLKPLLEGIDLIQYFATWTAKEKIMVGQNKRKLS